MAEKGENQKISKMIRYMHVYGILITEEKTKQSQIRLPIELEHCRLIKRKILDYIRKEKTSFEQQKKTSFEQFDIINSYKKLKDKHWLISNCMEYYFQKQIYQFF